MAVRSQNVSSPTPLTRARRVVIKVGSALLVDSATGRLNRARLETLVADVVRLRKQGKEVVLVSSGAIALGRRHLGLPKGPLRLEESQPLQPSVRFDWPTLIKNCSSSRICRWRRFC